MYEDYPKTNDTHFVNTAMISKLVSCYIHFIQPHIHIIGIIYHFNKLTHKNSIKTTKKISQANRTDAIYLYVPI